MDFKRWINALQSWGDNISGILIATPVEELVAAALLPLLAIGIAVLINRRIDRWESRALHAKLLDFLAPLIAPVLATLLTAIALSVYIHSDHKPVILLLVFKLCIAWLAVHAARILATGRTAAWFIGFLIIPVTLLHLFDLWDPAVQAATDLQLSFGETKISLYQVMRAGVTLLIVIAIVNFILDRTDMRLRRVRNLRASNRVLVMKLTQIVLYFVVFMFGMKLFGVSFATLSIFSGAVGVGVGFGLQKIASNFISGLILLFEKSIEAGDLIELDAATGLTATVSRIGGRYTLVTTADGKDVLIPNEDFITQRVTSLTHTDRHGRIDITVGVDYDDDVPTALKLLIQAANETRRAVKEPAPTAFAMNFADSAIMLRLSFWVEDVTEGKLGPQTDAMIAILRLFKENGITIPYPHQVAVQPDTAGNNRTLKKTVSTKDMAKDKPAAKKDKA